MRGVLFIPAERRSEVFGKLRELRQGYEHRIEYRDIKVAHSPNFGVAERWLHWFKNDGVEYCKFKVFAVDQDAFRQFPYRGDDDWAYHVWRNTLTSFIAGITWSLGRPKALLLEIICDSTGDEDFLQTLWGLPDRVKQDMRDRRFEQRRRITEARAKGQPCKIKLFPMVRVRGAVRVHSSDPAKAVPGYEDEVEFIQLTDVILGSLWDAVKARKVDEKTRAGRIRLSREWKERVLLPWRARLPYYRTISVSMYPDENGRAYPATVLTEYRGRQAFPFYDEVFVSKSKRKKRHKGLAVASVVSDASHRR